MKKTWVYVCLLVLASLSAAFTFGFQRIKESLRGFEEVPVVSTEGRGEFQARISPDGTQIHYELRYFNIEGNVTQAHIHVGQRGVNGGISVFLCTNLGNGPAGTQPCPASPGMIMGTITAADVSPNIPATAQARGQGFDTGEMDALLKALRAGNTYVNVHSDLRPGGEIRSQISENSGHPDH